QNILTVKNMTCWNLDIGPTGGDTIDLLPNNLHLNLFDCLIAWSDGVSDWKILGRYSQSSQEQGVLVLSAGMDQLLSPSDASIGVFTSPVDYATYNNGGSPANVLCPPGGAGDGRVSYVTSWATIGYAGYSVVLWPEITLPAFAGTGDPFGGGGTPGYVSVQMTMSAISTDGLSVASVQSSPVLFNPSASPQDYQF